MTCFDQKRVAEGILHELQSLGLKMLAASAFLQNTACRLPNKEAILVSWRVRGVGTHWDPQSGKEKILSY